MVNRCSVLDRLFQRCAHRRLRSLSVLLLVACGGTASDSERTVEVTDSAGIELVRSLYAGFDTLAVTLREDLRIGQVDGPETYQFFRITGITVDTLGRIYVVNAGTTSIRVYDAEGVWVRDIGKRGTGPGEFTDVATPILWKDTLGITDQNRGQFAFFDTAGHFLSAFPISNADGRRFYPVAASVDGWAVWVVRYGEARRERRPGDVTRDTTRLGRMSAVELRVVSQVSSAQADSALRGRLFWESDPATWVNADEGVGGYFPVFSQGVWWAADGQGRFYLNPGYPYRIERFGLDGRLERRISRVFTPIAVTDEHVDEWLRRIEASQRTRPPGGFDRLSPARRQAEATRMEFFPPTRRIFASRNGELWVQRLDVRFDIGNWETVQGAPEVPFFYDVFDADGRYEFTIRLPHRVVPRWIDRRTMMGVLRDENDVEFVVRYRLEERSASTTSQGPQ